jgi:hypothetical protein
MTIDCDAPHYVVRVTNMPPTELECKCGTRREGADCLERMKAHVREGNAATAPLAEGDDE